MTALRQISPARRGKRDTNALAAVASRQAGVISRAQLESAGVSDSAISRWVELRRLERLHPGVYALGHSALSIQGRLTAALLYAGKDGLLSHTTAAWLWSLTDAEPKRIHVTVPGRRLSLPEVRVHHSLQADRARCRSLPVTSVARTLLDLATLLSFRQLRRAVAEADYRGLLNANEVSAVIGPGRHGSRALRHALASHLPQLARTLSVLEERFLELCESAGIPLPETNAKIANMRVDALWRAQWIVVELDGSAAHGGWAAIKRDREREMALRAKGFQVVRYTWDQVTNRPDGVAQDLRRLLAG